LSWSKVRRSFVLFSPAAGGLRDLTAQDSQTYRLGSHTLEGASAARLANSVAIPLKPNFFDTLPYLVERAGRLLRQR
jgi:hypothetical protein